MKSNLIYMIKMQLYSLKNILYILLISVAMYSSFIRYYTKGNIVVYALGLGMLSYLILRNFSFNDEKYGTGLLFSILPIKLHTVFKARFIIVYLFCIISTPVLILFSYITHMIKPDLFGIMTLSIIPYGLLLGSILVAIETQIFYIFEAQKADIIAALILLPITALATFSIKLFPDINITPVGIIILGISALAINFCVYTYSAKLYKNREF